VVNVHHRGSTETFEQGFQECQTEHELSTTRRLHNEQAIR
jgi:hypothetical protein